MPKPVALATLSPLLAAALLLVGCGGSDTAGSRSSCPTSTAAATDSLPADLDLTSLGTVTSASGAGDLSAVVVTEGDAKATVEAVASLVQDSGWKVTRRENEDREGEVFFAKGARTGVARVDSGECEGSSVVEVTVTGGG